MSAPAAPPGRDGRRARAGRAAIVTGAARGLGRAAAARLHERGASVAVNRTDLGCRMAAGARSESHRALSADRGKGNIIEHKELTSMKPKNTICLWFDKDA